MYTTLCRFIYFFSLSLCEKTSTFLGVSNRGHCGADYRARLMVRRGCVEAEGLRQRGMIRAECFRLKIWERIVNITRTSSANLNLQNVETWISPRHALHFYFNKHQGVVRKFIL